ncbi:hypothetical protein EG329_011030 [Mollisiaceae sp. DMI_Dod_QoI]|nr:hypothetical protein EG329_011030 [Helotiales sp. DMI_Dod_QoI]
MGSAPSLPVLSPTPSPSRGRSPVSTSTQDTTSNCSKVTAQKQIPGKSPALLQVNSSLSPRTTPPNRIASQSRSQSQKSAPPTSFPITAPLSPMARFKQTARRNNPSRAQRRQPIVESPEFEPSSCLCPLSHKDLDACARDPKSLYYSPGSDTTTSSLADTKPAMEKKQKITTRGGKKRKAETFEEEVKYECECGGGHDTELECEYAVTLQKHVEIVTSIIIGSQTMVTVNIGTETKQSFLVHKELLALYSEYFHDTFSDRVKKEVKIEAKEEVKQEVKLEPGSLFPRKWGSRRNILDSDSESDSGTRSLSSTPSNPGMRMSIEVGPVQPVLRLRPKPEDSKSEDNRITKHGLENPEVYDLPNITPSQFAQFVSFLYAGRIIDAFDPLILATENNSPEALWYVGQYLRSPDFQNNILEGLRTTSSTKSGCWPSAEDMEIIYNLHEKAEDGIRNADGGKTGGGNENSSGGAGENLLKKFAAHCIAANSPFERHEPESAEGQAWKKLFGKKSEIGMDVLIAGGTRWALRKPWDDKLRGDYMVEEEGVEERWGEMILAKRGRVGVKEAAKAGDVGAKLEKGHLEAQNQKLGCDED